MPSEYHIDVFRLVCVPLKVHGTCFMLRASEAEVVVIDAIVVPGSRLGPRRLSAGTRISHVFASLIVTTQVNEKGTSWRELLLPFIVLLSGKV